MEKVRAAAHPSHVSHPDSERRCPAPLAGGQAQLAVQGAGAGRGVRGSLHPGHGEAVRQPELHHHPGLHVEQLLRQQAAGEGQRESGGHLPGGTDLHETQQSAVRLPQWPAPRLGHRLRRPGGCSHHPGEQLQEAGLVRLRVSLRFLW